MELLLDETVNLEELLLGYNRIGNKGALAIASNTSWKKLKVLDLAANRVGDEGAIALGRNGEWNQLLSLALFDNEIGWKGAIALGSNSTWSENNKIDLSGNMKLTEERIGALVACPVVCPGILMI